MRKKVSRFAFDTAENQILVILVLAFVVLLAGSTLYQVSQISSAEEWAKSDYIGKTIIFRVVNLDRMRPEEIPGFVESASRCDEGFTVTDKPFVNPSDTEVARDIQRSVLANFAKMPDSISLNKSMKDISVANAAFTQRDFAFAKCESGQIDFPVEGVVISVRLKTGEWVNLAVIEQKFDFGGDTILSAIRLDLFFLLVGIIALFFVRRLTQPLSRLTKAVSRFGSNLEVEDVEENGPGDIRKAIRRFNMMQREVRDEMKRRTQMLASIGHDIRTPLTALRVKVELIENEEAREEIIASIEKIDRITASALDFVRGESRSEPKQDADLRALIESECSEFEELGHQVSFNGKSDVHYNCRPIALARAIRNLIDNAVKYAGSAEVDLIIADDCIEISVQDSGPGIPHDQITQVLDPFTRLSESRESEKGGLGLGLSIAKAIVDGHDGTLKLGPRKPQGLEVMIQLPILNGAKRQS